MELQTRVAFCEVKAVEQEAIVQEGGQDFHPSSAITPVQSRVDAEMARPYCSLPALLLLLAGEPVLALPLVEEDEEEEEEGDMSRLAPSVPVFVTLTVKMATLPSTAMS